MVLKYFIQLGKRELRIAKVFSYMGATAPQFIGEKFSLDEEHNFL